jgi:hypothetical protein
MYSSHVDGGLLSHLHNAGLKSAIVDLKSFRVRGYWANPKRMLQDGWKLGPSTDPRRGLPREWMLGDSVSGQRISFDREHGLVRLLTYVRDYGQQITVEVDSGRVLHNQMAEANC